MSDRIHLRQASHLPNARSVLKNCRQAVDLLEQEEDPDKAWLFWVAAISLARATVDVADKVDGKQHPGVAKALKAMFTKLKATKPEPKIYHEFIVSERNLVLKEHVKGFQDEPVTLTDGINVYELGDRLYCPLSSGPFEGEDFRDVLLYAITWLEHQLDEADDLVRASE